MGRRGQPEWREFNHGDEDMIARFVDIMTVSRPDLCVVDALICGEGDGPIANLPRWCGASSPPPTLSRPTSRSRS